MWRSFAHAHFGVHPCKHARMLQLLWNEGSAETLAEMHALMRSLSGVHACSHAAGFPVLIRS